jgi:hypothetical protein
MSDYATTQTAPRTGMKFKHVLIMLLIAFIGGGVAVWWLADEYGYLDRAIPALSEVSQAQPTAPMASNMAPAVAPVTLDGTEDRLNQINADAAAASGNAARAESLLVAFAARRAIDSGAPLGYLADQLRLRFGTSQPQAVSNIISASQAPVTLEMLRVELKGLEPALLTGNSDAGIWTSVKREMSELFVLRKDGAPSPAPTQRLERAQTFVEAGNMPAAMAEVSSMPGAAAAQSWLVRAKRYSDARKALDRLERGALVAPIAAPAILPSPPMLDEAQPPLSKGAVEQ